MRLSSGRVLTQLDIEIVELMAKHRSVSFATTPFKLKSGIESNVYMNGREDFSDHPDLLWRVAERLVIELREMMAGPSGTQVCALGLPTAATPLATAVSLFSAVRCMLIGGVAIGHRVVREHKKEHGLGASWVVGAYHDGLRPVILDQVMTMGTTRREYEPLFVASGYPEKLPMLVLVDREQGGSRNLRAEGFRVASVYTLLDIVDALHQLNRCSADVLESVRDEIAAHQALPTVAPVQGSL